MTAPTYLVTGFARSGTSMMMRALYEGMERKVKMVVDDARIEALNSGEHIPNHEYLEPPLEAFTTPEFPRMYAGQLLKCLMAGMHPLWPLEGGLHIVQMWRDPRIIKESWEKCTTLGPVPAWLPDGYMVRSAACSAMLKNRKDVLSHTDLFFPEVISDPGIAFRKLRNAGWPLKIDLAVAVVDPEKIRAQLALAGE